MTGTGADQPVRERALSARESFIVQAPAGSGKTELLIQRYLNLLAHVSEPEEIVAITFTIKAAAEMRERILEALRRAAAGETGDEGVSGRRLALARRAVDNDRRHGWEIINHPARLQIQTIDALCLSLTRRLPYLSGFAAPSGILDDPGAAYRRAAVETIRLLGGRKREWNDALERFLVHVDNDMALATGLIADMLASRDQWLRHIGDDRASPEQLAGAWRAVVDDYLARADALFPADLKAPLVECADAAAAHAENEDAAGAASWLDGTGFPEAAAGQLGRWRFIAGLLLTRYAPQWRQKIDKRQGFPQRSPAKKPMQALLAALSGHGELAEALHRIRTLPEPHLDPEQAGMLNAMTTVLKLSVAQLRLVFEETGQVDFVEVTERAIAALGSLEAPSDLALKLDYRIQHLLVDEFQDTSIAQYHLLGLLTQGWAPEDGRTLFLVGDPVQSIYRFREAEVGVFLRVWEDGVGTVPVQPLSLRSNFRSSPRIVDWVNRAFAGCFPKTPDLQHGAVAYAGSTPELADTGAGEGVRVHPFVDCPPRDQAARLAELIDEARARSDDVAILVRARPDLNELLPALRAREIPYAGVDITALIDEPAARDLLSLTRALLHPGDRMAWLSLLRAPWCGLVLADLLAVAGPRRRLVWDALQDEEARAGVSAGGLARIDRFRRAMTGAMTQRGRLTLRQWVRRAWIELGGPAVVDDAGLEHASAYFNLLGRHQSGMSLVDEAAFTEALRGQRVHAEARRGAVQVMTIHRAKGLEFDEVFLPVLDRAERSGDKRLLLWEELTDDRGLLLSVLSARGAAQSGHYRFLRELQSIKAANETDRLLYVACTRARRRLHLSAHLVSADGGVPPPRRDSLLRRIWPAVERDFAAARPAPAQGRPPEPASPPPLARLAADWAPPPLPAALAAPGAAPLDEEQVEFSWAGETARLVGILVHELMRRIATEGLVRWDEQRVAALRPAWREYLGHTGVPPRELDHAVERTADAIRSLLRDDLAEWLLRPDHERAANELEVSVMDGERVRRLRIDRTFVDERGVRWIVDYKTSAHEGGAREAFLDEEMRRYRGRMELYAGAFRRMGADDIRLGLYFPLLTGWREWPADGASASMPPPDSGGA